MRYVSSNTRKSIKNRSYTDKEKYETYKVQIVNSRVNGNRTFSHVERNFVGKGIFLRQVRKGKIDAHSTRQRSFDRTYDNVISCHFCYRLDVATSKPKWKYFHTGQALSKKKRRFLYRTVKMKRRYWQQQMYIKISHGYLRKSIDVS